MSLAVSYVVQMVYAGPNPRHALAAVEALAGTPFSPTHWGPVQRVRRRFDRGALADAIGRAPADNLLPNVLRTDPPRYQCLLSVAANTPTILLESQLDLGPDDRQAFFEIGSAIASRTPIELGLVEPMYAGGYDVQNDQPDPSTVYAPAWPRTGPHRVYARTFFGPRLISLLGDSSTLVDAGMEVVHKGHDLIAADVTHEPWTANAAAHWNAVARATEALQQTGAFATTLGRGRFEPGARWGNSSPSR